MRMFPGSSVIFVTLGASMISVSKIWVGPSSLCTFIIPVQLDVCHKWTSLETVANYLHCLGSWMDTGLSIKEGRAGLEELSLCKILFWVLPWTETLAVEPGMVGQIWIN